MIPATATWVRRLDGPDWEVTLAGEQLGQFLTDVTARALGTEERESGLLPTFVNAEDARRLLPTVQRAVLLAAAGMNRFERLFPDEDAPPAEPLCVNCNAGSYDSGDDAISGYCFEHGHTPFGVEDHSWERAQQRYEQARMSWDRRHPKGH